MENKNKKSVKLTVLLLALILLLGCFIGGTLAWLVTHTEPVVNTFTVGNIELKLKEHKLDGTGELLDGEENVIDLVTKEYKVIPGTTLNKDPFLRVTGGSESCWVFVEVVEEYNLARAYKPAADGQEEVTELKYVSWAVDNAVWTQLVDNENKVVPNVYYLEYTMQTADKDYNILAEKKVTHSQDLTKAMLNSVGDNKPTLTFKAIAIQSDYLTMADGTAADSAADAWEVYNTPAQDGNN